MKSKFARGGFRELFLGDNEGLVSVYAAAHGRLLGTSERETEFPRTEVSSLHYVAEDDVLIVVADRKISVLDARVCADDAGAAPTGKKKLKKDDVLLPTLRRMRGAHEQKITAVTFSRDLSLIATACPGHSVCLWDFQTLKLEDVCVGLSDDAIALEFLATLPVLLVVGGRVLGMGLERCAAVSPACTSLTHERVSHACPRLPQCASR
jgi:WD40 repeat protein